MRFLLLNQFYPPDPAPTGWYLHGLATELARRGHAVKVLCSRHGYDGAASYPAHASMDGVEVTRLAATGFGRRGYLGKLADYGTFYFVLFSALMMDSPKPDLILALTTPPYVGVLAKLAARKDGCPHAHWIMDLYPDVLYADKGGNRGRWSRAFLQELSRWQLRGAQTVVCLGPVMAERVSAYAAGTETTTFAAPLWSDPNLGPADVEAKALRGERGWPEGELVLLYSGNMGVGHRFLEFLEAARRLGADGPRWVFSGGGKRRGEIAQFARSHPEARIELLGYAPQERLRAHLGAADVHLASLHSSWQGLMVPSKLQGSFAAARPVLFVGGWKCETALWISESGGGWVVEEGDLDGLLAAVAEASQPQERRRRGEAAWRFAQENFRMSENVARLAGLLEGTSPRLPSLRADCAVT